MGDWSFFDEFLDALRQDVVGSLPAATRDRDRALLHLSGLDSQVKSLKSYMENESRKRLVAEERVQALESELAVERLLRASASAPAAGRDARDAHPASARSPPHGAASAVDPGRLQLVRETKEIAAEVQHVAQSVYRLLKSRARAAQLESERLATFEQRQASFARIGSVVPLTVVICLDVDSTLLDAAHIRSFPYPIYADDDLRGLVTLDDVIIYLRAQCATDDDFGRVLRSFATDSGALGAVTMQQVMAWSGRSCWPVFFDTSISALVNTFSTGHAFVPVCDRDGMIFNVVTAASLVAALSFASVRPAIVASLGGKAEATVEQLGLLAGPTRPACVRLDQPAVEALELLHAHKGRNVAAVDDCGVLVASVSVREFQNVNVFAYEELLLPVRHFVDKHQLIAITATAQTTLRALVDLFVQHKPETVWIVDADRRIVGACHVCDLFRMGDIDWDGLSWR